MKTASKNAGFAMAAAAAAMLATAPMAANAGSDEIHCVGVNSCKGTSDCKTATSACKGQNSCKGHGFLSITKAECDAKGGTVES